MKATLLRQYPSKKNPGQINYTYVLDGNSEEIAMYKQSQGDYLRLHDDGRPLFFTDKFGVDCVKFSSKGEPFADTSEIDNLSNYVGQMQEGTLKNATAQALAQHIIAKFSKPAPSATASVPVKEADDAGELGSL